MLKYLFLMVPLLLFASLGQATDCDLGIGSAKDIAALRDRDPASGVEQGLAALGEFEGQPTVCPLAQALLHRAVAVNLHILGRYSEAHARLDRALTALAGIDDAPPEHAAKIYLTAGVVRWAVGKHDEAIAQYLKALDASERAGDSAGVGRAAGNIGNLYSTMGNHQRALDYHQQALSAFEQAGAVTGMAGSLVNLAALSGRQAKRAVELGDPEQARGAYVDMRAYALRALDRFQSLENPRGIAYASANIAEALEGLGQSESALESHQQALELQQEVGDRGGQVQTLIAMARTYLDLERYHMAAERLEEASSLREPGRLGVAVEIEALRVAVAEGLGDYRAALEHQKSLTRLQSEIDANQMAARVEEVRLAMEADQREQEIELLQSEAEVAGLQMKRQQALLITAVLFAILLLGLLGALYSRYRTRVKTSRELDIASRTDPLTGLSNRRDMMERLLAAGVEARKNGIEHCLILADIDDFKHVNDDYGHSVGDEVLERIAELMAGSVKGQDVVCRWGGEEFLILLLNTGTRGATAVAENLRRAVANQPIETSSRAFDVTISLGVALLNADTPTDDAISRADRAMYRAKQAGKNRFEIDRQAEKTAVEK